MAKIDEHVKVMMLKGEPGSSIKSIDKTATHGLTDTYTVTLTDGTKSNFTVTNGRDGKDGADFDTFEIGGRNLARNSANLDITPDKGNLCVGKYKEGVIEDRGDGFKAVRIYNPYRGIGVYANVLGLNPGDRLVFSTVFEPSGKDLEAAFFAIGSDSSGNIVHNFLYVNSSTVLGDSAILGTVEDGDSKRLSVSIKWTDEAKRLIDSGGSIELAIETVDGIGSGNSASFYAPKLERGTKPSDWTPAPEDKADASIQNQIVPSAAVESSATASQAYAAGDYVVVNGVLRKVKSAIAKGNAISDSNSTSTTVIGELATVSQIEGWFVFDIDGVKLAIKTITESVSVASPYTSDIYYGNVQAASLPSGVFANAPACSASIVNASATCWIASLSGSAPTKDETQRFRLLSSSNETINVSIMITAIGA